MASLEQAFNELDPSDLEAVTSHALERIRTGEWTDDVGRMLAQMVAANHGEGDLTRYLERVGRALQARAS